jgi:hypothetical protein
MITNLNTSSRQTVLRALRRVGADAVLGATCCGLYGFVFGGFGALAQSESHRLSSIAISFAVGGAVAGSLVGVWSAFFTANAKTPESYGFPHERTETKQAPTKSVPHLLVRRQCQTLNSPAA